MAKSYKKYPILKQEKVNKKHWNRGIRNLKIDYSLRGSQYKKIFPNYNTWQYRWTLEDAIETWNDSEYYQGTYTLESWIEYWKRLCYRK
ncbi:MAG: hypothetical protein J6A59_12535 [Lachnospiraceae bacterium]|nr:hypothetical protein [Lachnospiraceae bacterium]